jgi:GT2 family glycosyltransferase
LLHDETDLCYRLERAGGEIRYAPDAVVDHYVTPERLSPAWMLRRHYHGGESAAIFVLRNRGVLRALWRIWWLYGTALATRRYPVREPVDAARFARECRRHEALGYLAGIVRTLPRLAQIRRDMAASW